MKIFLFLIGMVAAGIIGYSFEPDLRFQLTGKAPFVKKSEPRHIIVETGAPIKKIDPATYPADQLPEKILLHADAEVANKAGDLKMSIPAGSRVNLIRVEGANVVISPGAGPFEGLVPVIKTDLVEQLTALPATPGPETVAQVDPIAEPVADLPAETDASNPTEEPAADTATEPEMADNGTETAADPVAPPADPDPAADPEPSVPDGPVDVVAVMQASIKAGEIKEFTFDKVLDWQASAEPENVDGQSYQTGIASYKAETVFGMKTIQAKALIKGGKVTRWLWPKSGMEIK